MENIRRSKRRSDKSKKVGEEEPNFYFMPPLSRCTPGKGQKAATMEVLPMDVQHPKRKLPVEPAYLFQVQNAVLATPGTIARQDQAWQESDCSQLPSTHHELTSSAQCESATHFFGYIDQQWQSATEIPAHSQTISNRPSAIAQELFDDQTGFVLNATKIQSPCSIPMPMNGSWNQSTDRGQITINTDGFRTQDLEPTPLGEAARVGGQLLPQPSCGDNELRQLQRFFGTS